MLETNRAASIERSGTASQSRNGTVLGLDVATTRIRSPLRPVSPRRSSLGTSPGVSSNPSRQLAVQILNWCKRKV